LKPYGAFAVSAAASVFLAVLRATQQIDSSQLVILLFLAWILSFISYALPRLKNIITQGFGMRIELTQLE
jgi:hypothetical protein